MSNNPLRAAAAWAVRRYGRPSVAEPPDHNAARWLKIVPFRVVAAGPQSATRWWVLRTCPCHPGEPVAAPFATEAEAVRFACTSSCRCPKGSGHDAANPLAAAHGARRNGE